jgi:thiol:disulfide interchange protein DsbC
VNLEGMSSVYATSDGKYIIQGEVIRLGDKELPMSVMHCNLQKIKNYLQHSKLKI